MDNKLTGIKANNSSISISFTYNNVRCRETVKVKPTKSSLKEMARKRDAILYEIEFGQFDYLKHFLTFLSVLVYFVYVWKNLLEIQIHNCFYLI